MFDPRELRGLLADGSIGTARQAPAASIGGTAPTVRHLPLTLVELPDRAQYRWNTYIARYTGAPRRVGAAGPATGEGERGQAAAELLGRSGPPGRGAAGASSPAGYRAL
jgi:hypothetical protein